MHICWDIPESHIIMMQYLQLIQPTYSHLSIFLLSCQTTCTQNDAICLAAYDYNLNYSWPLLQFFFFLFSFLEAGHRVTKYALKDAVFGQWWEILVPIGEKFPTRFFLTSGEVPQGNGGYVAPWYKVKTQAGIEEGPYSHQVLIASEMLHCWSVHTML